MNDKELDEKVRQLFDAHTISVDVDGEAARALLEDIVDGGVASPNEPNLLAEAQADDDPSSATDVVVDLRSGRGSMSGELDANRRVRSLVAVAAVLALVVVLIAGIVLSREDGTLAVISDDGRADTADAVEFPVAERIDGPEEPLLILAPEASAIAEIDTCIERTSEFDSGGLGLVTFASVDDPSGFAPGWVVLSDGISLRECSIDENSQENYSSTPSLLFDEDRDVLVIAGGTSRQDGTEEVTVDVVGLLSEEVVSVELAEVDPAVQIFRRQGSSFRIDAALVGEDPSLSLRAEFIDGSVRTIEPAELIPVCEQLDCVREMTVELAEEARTAGAVEQAELLADGVLTPSEFSLAQDRFAECLEVEAEIAFVPPLVLSLDESTADTAVECWSREIVGVEIARGWQNLVLSTDVPAGGVERRGSVAESETERIVEQEEELVDAVRTEQSRAELADAARTLFADGLDREELETRWDGYPFGADETDSRIDTFLADFAWINGDIEVEVHLYEQFEGSGFLIPVVTVWPAGEPERAAVFVTGGTPEDLRIGRIPEASDGLLEHSFTEGLENDDGTVVVDVVGTEGGVSAFASGASLETVIDQVSATTLIVLPDDREPNTVITVVSATPEVPAAAVLVVP